MGATSAAILVAAKAKEPSPAIELFVTLHSSEAASPAVRMPLERRAYSPYALLKSIRLSSCSRLPSVNPPLAK